MRTIFFGAAVLGAAVVACSSSSSGTGGGGSGSVNGTFGGHALAAKDAIAQFQTETPQGSTTMVATASIVIADIAGACSVAQRNVNPANASFLLLAVGSPGSQVATGTYTIGGGTGGTSTMLASAFYGAQDAQCKTTLNEMGMSGTITISAVSASSISGSFDVTFTPQTTGTPGGSSDHVTGTFTAPTCSIPMTDGGASMATCGS